MSHDLNAAVSEKVQAIRAFEPTASNASRTVRYYMGSAQDEIKQDPTKAAAWLQAANAILSEYRNALDAKTQLPEGDSVFRSITLLQAIGRHQPQLLNVASIDLAMGIVSHSALYQTKISLDETVESQLNRANLPTTVMELFSNWLFEKPELLVIMDRHIGLLEAAKAQEGVNLGFVDYTISNIRGIQEAAAKEKAVSSARNAAQHPPRPSGFRKFIPGWLRNRDAE